ncbi:MAG: DoxX family protein [Sphingobacteriales bacterium]|nr:DoxX family protein [Sphingobacteriales bacterium]
MQKRIKSLIWGARIFVGLLFIFSGLIKLNDPLGFSYKLEEYFEVFHLVFLNPISVFLSIFLCSLEVILGVLLLAGFYAKKVVWGLLLLIIFFTFLTFYSAVFNVVKTCGCFGDAIPLTPWQSFSKDLVLLLLIVFLFIHKGAIHPFIKNKNIQIGITAPVVILTIWFGLFTYNFLPIIDFLPYKVGVNILEAMKIPKGAPQDVYVITYTLKNKKTGEEKKMSDQEYLKTKIYEDSHWELIASSDPKLIKAGYQPKIKDLNVYDAQGVNYNNEIFGNPYVNLVAVAWNLDKTNKKALGDINAIAINAVENYNIRSILLTSNSAQDAEQLSKKMKLMLEVFYADAVPLKSMVRSNPGLILLKNGVIIKKWPAAALPTYDELEKNYFSKDE